MYSSNTSGMTLTLRPDTPGIIVDAKAGALVVPAALLAGRIDTVISAVTAQGLETLSFRLSVHPSASASIRVDPRPGSFEVQSLRQPTPLSATPAQGSFEVAA